MMYRVFGSRFFVVALLAAYAIGAVVPLFAQPAPSGTGRPVAGATGAAATGTAAANERMRQADALAQQALATPGTADEVLPPLKEKPTINFFELAKAGGPLMYPIYLGSIVVVCFSLERALALQKRKLMPPTLIQELGELSKRQGGVDPRAAYRACMKHPSTAATVIKAVLLKIGRPFAELEATLKEVNEREAAKLYKNVRPIELQVSVAPLLGLLGTVQGMIMAFFETANAGAQSNIAEHLAQGIYVALVTTFAGLCVAIPAAVLAHTFEGKIQNLFRDLDEFVLAMLPQWERFEGKLRVNRQSLSGEGENTAAQAQAAAQAHPEHHAAATAERLPPPIPR